MGKSCPKCQILYTAKYRQKYPDKYASSYKKGNLRQYAKTKRLTMSSKVIMYGGDARTAAKVRKMLSNRYSIEDCVISLRIPMSKIKECLEKHPET